MKRLFDVVSSIYGLVVLSPILLITALLIKMESPGPAIFKQKDRRLIMNCLIFISLDQ
ncbi:bacterial sugar transferase domain protein [Staphylococcus aureus subsp. aureus IS-M]|nr:bacterial sugar transferase domain protein [Staphylococcus aureus subsp. aureus IS-157]EID41626.1 bacterial sugar transferase domain protein [Staphylococcus aureus subsp. aureus IS-M]